jgi:putative flippase GtrA
MALSSLTAVTPNRIIRKISVKVGGETKHKEVERFIKFLIVGTIGALIDLGLTNFMMKFVFHVAANNVVPVLISGAIGFSAAVTSNFLWNRYWTYPDSRSRPIAKQVAQFVAVNAVGLGIRLIILNLLYIPAVWLVEHISQDLIHFNLSANQEARIGANAVIMVAQVIVLFWNFFVNRHWTYNDVQ